jgi:formamidase
MSGVVTINFKVMKDGMADLSMKSPLYLPGPVEPHYGPGRYLTFEGFSVDEHGKQVCCRIRVPPNVPKPFRNKC